MSCPDRCFIEVDLANAEWIVTAFVCNDARMIEVATGEEGAHAITGSLISGAPLDFVKREDAHCGHTTDPEELKILRKELTIEKDWFLPRTMTIRQAGKKSNHGLNYGMEAARFSLENEVELKDAKKMVHAYRNEAYPGLTNWYESIREQLQRDRTLTNLWGHKRKFLERWDNSLLLAAYAYISQSTIGTYTNKALVKLYHYENSRYEPLTNIHDSILGQAWPRSWNEFAATTQDVMDLMYFPLRGYGGREFEIKREAKIGKNARDLKTVEQQDGESLAEAIERTWTTLCELD